MPRALPVIEKHQSFCRICEALCGIEVTVEDGRITKIEPDASHVATQGFACPKGLKQHKMYDSPDRVKAPLKRVGDTFVEVSWETAIREIGAKVRQLRSDHDPDTVGMYVGTAAGFGVLHPAFAQGFLTALGSKSMYASATQDCSNKFAIAREMYGFPFSQPFPDLANTGCMIVVGANPVVSKWSFLQVPNPTRTLRDMVARVAKLFVVDPRKTETARAAGEHVFIRPGTDVWFYAAFLNELIAQGGVDRALVEKHTRGFDELASIVAPWTAERASEVTKIPAETLRAMVTAYRTAKPGAVLYCSTGVNMGGYGGLAFWLQEAINAVSGNLDRAGGALVSRGVIDFPAFGKRTGTLLRNDRSRVGDHRSVNDAFPGGVLADEILTPGPKQVRALFVTGGNPLITMAGAGRLREAFSKLELLVTLDIYRNETGQLAHYVLPCTSPLERPDLPFIFPLMLGLQSKPYLQATRAMVSPPGQVRDEASIYLDLCRASGVGFFGSKVAQGVLEGLAWAHGRKRKLAKGAPRELPQELLLQGLLKVTKQPAFEALLNEHPHGYAREGHRAGSFLPERILTDDKRVNLAPRELVEQARARMEPGFLHEKSIAGALKLITKRQVTTHNSWTHNLGEFVEGDRGTNYLYMHPDDAKARALSDGDVVDVATDTATVRVGMKLLPELMPGTVALPHGWGHQHAKGLSVASKTRGVNVNLLAASGPDRIEPVSNMSHLTGFVVNVTAASGPRDETSWSGIAPAEA